MAFPSKSATDAAHFMPNALRHVVPANRDGGEVRGQVTKAP
jgi:hypothetical protein